MGDSGAMFIGLAMAGAIVSAGGKLDPSTFGPRSTIALLAPLIVALAVVFIPVLDFLLAVIRRTKEGRHPFSADKQHLHHRMLAIGHTHRQAVLIFYLWAFVLAGCAVVAGVRDVAGGAGAVPGAGRDRPRLVGVAARAGPQGQQARPRHDPVGAGVTDQHPAPGPEPTSGPASRPAVDLSARAAEADAIADRSRTAGIWSLRHLRLCWTVLLAGGLVLGVVAAFVAGAGAVVGVVIGTVIVGMFFIVLGAWSSPGSARTPGAVMVAALFAYIIKVVLLALVLLTMPVDGFVDTKWMAGAIGLGLFGWLAAHMRYVWTLKLFYVDPG